MTTNTEQAETPGSQGNAAPSKNSANKPDNASDDAHDEAENEGENKASGSENRKPDPSADEAKRKRDQSRYDKKIGALTFQARQAQRENAELRAKLEALEKRTAPPPPTRPKRADYDSEEAYDDAYYDYRRALEKAEEAEEGKARKDGKGDNRQSSGNQPPTVTREQWEEKETAFARAHPDYEEVIADLEIPRTTVGATLSYEILKHKQGPALLYKLGNDPDLLDQVLALPRERVPAKLDRIAETLKKGASDPPNKQLPDPPEPLKGASATKSENGMSGRELRKKAGLIK